MAAIKTCLPVGLGLGLLIFVNVCCQDKHHTACGFVRREITSAKGGHKSERSLWDDLTQTNEVVSGSMSRCNATTLMCSRLVTWPLIEFNY